MTNYKYVLKLEKKLEAIVKDFNTASIQFNQKLNDLLVKIEAQNDPDILHAVASLLKNQQDVNESFNKVISKDINPLFKKDIDDKQALEIFSFIVEEIGGLRATVTAFGTESNGFLSNFLSMIVYKYDNQLKTTKLYDNLNKIFKDYIFREWQDGKELVKIMDKARSETIKLESKINNKKISEQFPFTDKTKLKYQGTCGKINLTLKITSTYLTMESHYNNVKRDVELYLKDDFLNNKAKRYLQSLNTYSPKEVELGILDILKNTVIDILEKNPELVRVSDFHLNIKLVPEIENNKVRGIYALDSSSFSDVYIILQSTVELESAVLNNDNKLKQDTIIYETLVHELMHAYDWRLNVNKSDVQTLYKIIGETPLPETYWLYQSFSLLRQEGLARFAELIDSSFSLVKYYYVINMEDMMADIQQKEVLMQFFDEALLPNSSIFNMDEHINLVHGKERILHYKIGKYMCFIMMLDRLKDDVILISKLNWVTNLKEKSIRFFNRKKEEAIEKSRDILFPRRNHGGVNWYENISLDTDLDSLRKLESKYRWKEIGIKDLHKNMYPESGLFILIPKTDLPKIKQFMTAISLMTNEQFFASYLAACNDLKIDPEPITPRRFKEFNEEKKKQTIKLMEQFGF